MTYINNPNEEEEKKLGPDGLPVIQSANTQAAYSSDTSSSSSPGGSASAPIAPNAGTGFVNLDKYRQANKGAGQITADAVGKKAASAFETASQEADKLDTNVQGLSLSDSLIQGVANTNAGLDDSQKAELNQVRQGYQGPNDLNTAGYKAAYDTANTEANKYTDRDMQKAALKDLYENNAKQRGIVYNNKSAELDAALMEDNQGQITDAVNAVKKSVDDKANAKKTTFDANKTAAKQSFDAGLGKIKDTAVQARDKLKLTNQAEISQKNDERKSKKAPAFGSVSDEGSDASWGDVVDNNEVAAANKFDDILGGKTFDSLNGTWRDKSYTINPPTVRNPDAPLPTPGQIMINPDLMNQPAPATPQTVIKDVTNPSDPLPTPGQIMINPDLLGLPSAPARKPSGGGGGGNSTSKYRKPYNSQR